MILKGDEQTVKSRFGNLIKHKIRENKGISLVELLVTIIFCLMTFSLVVTAMQAAVRQLKTQTMYSESKLLCSTLAMSVEDVLRYAGSGDALIAGTGSIGAGSATDESISAGRDYSTELSELKFYSRTRYKANNSYFEVTDGIKSYGDSSGTSSGTTFAEGRIILVSPKSGDGTGSSDDTIPTELAPSSGYTQGMKADLSLKWHGSDDYSESDPKYHTFTGTVYVTDSKGNVLCSQTFAVKPINVND